MDLTRKKNIYISNLEFISYQSKELIHDENSNIYYNDFYTFYNGYVKHLKEVKWENNSIEEQVKKFPVIQKPRLSFQLLSMTIIPLLAALIFQFNIFEYLIAFLLLLIFVIILVWWRSQRNKGRLNKIIKICSSLKREIELLS